MQELLARFPVGAVTADAELAALMAVCELILGSVGQAKRHLAMAARELASVPRDRRGRLEVMLAVAAG